ncbi:Transcription factor bHLH30 [Raphanus sativus]|uniref:Transcription factor bHLH30 n=1 Tax=Raphanus sativus TaxID=3726 RepID=A0A6J0MA76_RAPSA|nr:transcription factor bHLH30 [Raphanus sativus]KAJ4909723.1 Transcription factor bHLH30 [Raphanus sativus]
MCAKKQEEVESSEAMNNIQNYQNDLFFHQLISHHHHQDPSQAETSGAPDNNAGSGYTIFSQDSVSPIWPTSAQPPFDQFPPPSFYGSFFNRSRAHHQGLQFGYEGFGGATSATHHHHEQLRILSEALGPVVQVGSGPFGLQAELGKMTAQEIMDAKALAASKSHSEAERRRRERINNHFAKLRSILPSTTKTDKASLLAEVIQHVKELKRETSVISETNLVPTESNELTVAFTEEEDSGDGRFVIKASVCCEDRSDLLPDMIKTLKAMRLKTIKAEITTVGERVRNVLFIAGEESSGEDGTEEYSIGTIEAALKAVIEKSNVEESSSSANAKRQRMSSHNTITIVEQQQHHM